MGLSSASRSRDSNQPDAAPCRHHGLCPGERRCDGPGSADSPPLSSRRKNRLRCERCNRRKMGPFTTCEARRKLTIAPTSCTRIKSPTTRTREIANRRATSCWTAALTTSTSWPATALTTSARKSERSIARLERWDFGCGIPATCSPRPIHLLLPEKLWKSTGPIITWCATERSPPASCRVRSGYSAGGAWWWMWTAPPKSTTAISG